MAGGMEAENKKVSKVKRFFKFLLFFAACVHRVQKSLNKELYSLAGLIFQKRSLNTKLYSVTCIEFSWYRSASMDTILYSMHFSKLNTKNVLNDAKMSSFNTFLHNKNLVGYGKFLRIFEQWIIIGTLLFSSISSFINFVHFRVF